MQIDKRVTRWARKACAVINALSRVLVAVRRLLVTALVLIVTLTTYVSAVVLLLK
jgi:hypothetical protein